MKTYSCTKADDDNSCVGYARGQCLSFENCQYKEEDISYEYTYFISYAHSKGFGNISLGNEHRLDSFHEIELLQKRIESKLNLKDVVVINFQLLKKTRK